MNIHHLFRCVAISLLITACSGTVSEPSIPSNKGRVVRDFLFLRSPGSYYTLEYSTTNIAANGEYTVTRGSSYRYTVLDTAFVRSTDGRRCVAVRRETITKGNVMHTDTSYQFADTSQLIVYERMSDTIGRRRLAGPLRAGTAFLYRDNLGGIESNIYHIVSLDSVVNGTMPAIHVRMATSTPEPRGTTLFQDEQFFSPSIGVILQRQTRRFIPADGSPPTTTILEFYPVQRSW